MNGEPQEVPEGLTVRGLVEHLGLTDGPVAVECNREVVPRAEHATTSLTAVTSSKSRFSAAVARTRGSSNAVRCGELT